MIDISDKKPTLREAVVEAGIRADFKVIERIRYGSIPKGNVLEAARLAAFFAAKKTSFLIPHCHPIAIEEWLFQK